MSQAVAGRWFVPVVAAAVIVPTAVVALAIGGSPAGGSAGGRVGTVVLGGSSVRVPRTAAPSTPTASLRPVSPRTTTVVASGRAALTAPVTVLNNSTISGLAHRVAARVTRAGFAVTSVGNLQGLVPESTVYYAPGDRAAAQQLAAHFASIRRILPAAAAGLPGDGLTLVVTMDWGTP